MQQLLPTIVTLAWRSAHANDVDFSRRSKNCPKHTVFIVNTQTNECHAHNEVQSMSGAQYMVDAPLVLHNCLCRFLEPSLMFRQ